MALEKMRKRWEAALQPVLNAFSSFSPATVTWMALPFGVAGGLLAMYAPDEATGGWWLLGGAFSIALAMLFDGLDGSLARAKGEVTRWGDYLDHTIDRVLKPRGVAVIVDAEHQCISTRGTRKTDISCVTRCFLGEFKTDPRLEDRLARMIG